MSGVLGAAVATALLLAGAAGRVHWPRAVDAGPSCVVCLNVLFKIFWQFYFCLHRKSNIVPSISFFVFSFPVICPLLLKIKLENEKNI